MPGSGGLADCCRTAQGRETPLETTRPSLTSSSTNFHVYDGDTWAIGKTVTITWPK